MSQEANAILNTWIERVNACDVEAIASMYKEDAVLLPTFSDQIRRTLEEKKDYFRGLAKYKSVTVTIHQDTAACEHLGGSFYSLTGYYAWRMETDGDPVTPEARYTYTIDVESDRPILHHHSSAVPE